MPRKKKQASPPDPVKEPVEVKEPEPVVACPEEPCVLLSSDEAHALALAVERLTFCWLKPQMRNGSTERQAHQQVKDFGSLIRSRLNG